MKKYTIEELNNLNENEIIAIARTIEEDQDDYSYDELKTIRNRLEDYFDKIRFKNEPANDIGTECQNSTL